ncbi:MAG: SDR family oxidoreductase [Pseudomonadota bacterium]
MGRLSGKRVLITAAGQGIGRASVEACAAEGAQVVAAEINADLVPELDAIDGVTGVQLDVTNGLAVAAAVGAMDTPDVLFNCAGFVHSGTILECKEEDWDFSFDLNVKAMYRLCKLLLPGMIAQGGGSIVNMASVVSSLKGAPNRFVYGASKAAVIGLTKAIAVDHVTQGIRCNAICPGTVDSPSLHDRLRAMGDYEAAKKAFTARQPMGRVATADEIAHLVVYLASDESAFTTGHAHIIDGGWAM